MLSVIMLSVIMLSVIMLSVVMLSDLAPFNFYCEAFLNNLADRAVKIISFKIV